VRAAGARIAAALLVTAGVAAGAGYAAGSSGGPSASDAAAARREAARGAESRAYAAALGRGLARGVADGRIEGAIRARAQGGRLGASAGAAGVSATVDALQAAQDARDAAHTTELAGTSGVLVVGDSLEVLTSVYLRRYLPSQPLTINVEGGLSSPQIFRRFQQSYDPSQSVIVFDAGTNDAPVYPQILAGRLEAVAKAIGDRCMVVPTIHGLPVNGVTDAGKNRVIRAFAAAHPGTQTPDWHAYAAAHPGQLQPDHLHPRPDGAAARARLIAAAVETCLASYADLRSGTP
jgi:hypothetical protein